ncbi:D-aminoacyl-tRNA deacylase (DTD) [Vairimorpha necatrix]|uniref:D-aminoacyl-tRNA deacylase n=1 Tax=Vairimorpha necatrix TaxID=6039 RepID=A0AAX4JDB1_9MICR
MKIICQKVKYAICKTETDILNIIGYGLVIFVGVNENDTIENVEFLAKKVLGIKIYDMATKTVIEKNQDILLIFEKKLSDTIVKSKAEEIYNLFYEKLTDGYPCGVVRRGSFEMSFKINICNQGPFTIILNK